MRNNSKHGTLPRQNFRGFTIVELLIVVVVIAILAAITIVAYNGIASQAKESALKSDLEAAGKQLQIAKVTDGSYPADTSGLKKSDSTTFGTYTHTTGDFCLDAAVAGSGAVFHVSSGGVKEGECPEVPLVAMQDFTSAQCNALTPYNNTTDTNGDIVELTDSRGGTTQTYEVARFGNACWMITNLKLGSTTSDITLTPSDSDVAANFTLPKLITSGATNYDTPQAIGPIPSDPGNYGYLYNFPAATAGESRTSLPATGGKAAHSICPAGWKLPTGGGAAGVSDFSKLDQVFGGSGVYQSSGPSIPKWQPGGPFKGALSGYWVSSFATQGSYGGLWSRSANPSVADVAFNASFGSSYVYPGAGNYNRINGLGVRCLLN